MKIVLTFVTLLLTSVSIAQSAFEEGYVITNDGVKTECLIRNLDWKNNPRSVVCQFPGAPDVKTLSEEQIMEFGISGFSKFQRFTVVLDTSSNDLSRLSTNSAPQFKKVTALLKVLIEGPISLFKYDDGDGTRFFFKTDTGSIEQLIYKHYVIDGKIGVSQYFRAQLRRVLKCPGMTPIQYDQLKYTQTALVTAFEKYYRCRRGQYTNYDDIGTQESLYLTFRPGINISSLHVQNENQSLRNTKFSTELSYRIGLEAEYALPFNRNQWSLLLEPCYQFYRTEKQTALGQTTVDFAVIDLSLGARYAMRPADVSGPFLNGSVIFSRAFESHSKLVYENDINMFTLRAALRASAGIGYKDGKTWSVEIRYHFSQNILVDYLGFDSQYKTISVIAGYTFF